MNELRESSLRTDLETATRIAEVWTKAFKEYYTILKCKDLCGRYYVTNRYDPRVVQWCKENGVVPEDR